MWEGIQALAESVATGTRTSLPMPSSNKLNWMEALVDIIVRYQMLPYLVELFKLSSQNNNNNPCLVEGGTTTSTTRAHKLAALHHLLQTAARLDVATGRLEAVEEILLVELAGVALLHLLLGRSRGSGTPLIGGAISIGVLPLH